MSASALPATHEIAAHYAQVMRDTAGEYIHHRWGGSETQRRNARGILAKSAASLDVTYIERWVEALGLGKEWALVRDEAARSTR